MLSESNIDSLGREMKSSLARATENGFSEGLGFRLAMTQIIQLVFGDQVSYGESQERLFLILRSLAWSENPFILFPF